MSFEVAEMKVDESDTLVHIDVFRYGPMSAPITLRVTDIPLTAKRSEFACYHLQQLLVMCHILSISNHVCALNIQDVISF